MYVYLHICTDGWLAGWLSGWMAGWMAGWLAGWMDGWMDGWTDWVFVPPGTMQDPHKNFPGSEVGPGLVELFTGNEVVIKLQHFNIGALIIRILQL